MSIDGHMLCEECKEWIFLGKWLRDDDDEGTGFWLSGLSDAELGMKITRFTAKHINSITE